MANEEVRPYPDGAAWDEAWLQRQQANKMENIIRGSVGGSMASFEYRVSQWARDRNIIGGTQPKDQFVKLVEEVGELSTGVQKDCIPQVKDAIGDCAVVLAIMAEQYGMTFSECCEAAWDEIKDRRGVVVNGVFVKMVVNGVFCKEVP